MSWILNIVLLTPNSMPFQVMHLSPSETNCKCQRCLWIRENTENHISKLGTGGVKYEPSPEALAIKRAGRGNSGWGNVESKGLEAWIRISIFSALWAFASYWIYWMSPSFYTCNYFLCLLRKRRRTTPS